MKIEDLKETAALAHLNMDAEELAGAFPAFEQMLGYFAAMDDAGRDGAHKSLPVVKQPEGAYAADTADGGDGAAFSGDAASIANFSAARHVSAGHFRPDTLPHNPQGLNDRPLSSDLLNNAGDRDGPFIVVPNVL